MSDPIISPEKLEKALLFLSETDASYAHEKAELERAAILCKRVRSRVFLGAEGTVAERNARSEVHAEVSGADDAYCATLEAFEKLKAQRERAEIVVRVFQTLEATRRATL